MPLHMKVPKMFPALTTLFGKLLEAALYKGDGRRRGKGRRSKKSKIRRKSKENSLRDSKLLYKIK